MDHKADNPWLAPLAKAARSRFPSRLRGLTFALLLAWFLGFGMGLVDVQRSSDLVSLDKVLADLFFSGLILGTWGRWWGVLAVPIFGICFYFVHILAILAGLQPPYVEESIAGSSRSLSCLIAVGPGAVLGASLRSVVSSILILRAKLNA